MKKAHNAWETSYQQAIALQKKLRDRVQITPFEQEVKLVGGADISFKKHEKTVYAGIIILQLPDLTEVARSVVTAKADFPYIPGLLSFRELPALQQAWDLLQQKPDVLLMDGHGIAHPGCLS